MKPGRALRIPNRGEGLGALNACFAVLVGACASLGACHHGAPSKKDTDPGPCWHRDCVYLGLIGGGDPFQRVHRTRIVTHITELETCNFEVFWPLPGGEGGSFHATVFPWERAVFPVHGELAQLVGCYGSRNSCERTDIECAMPPVADALFNPPGFAAVSPGADDVFIPVDGHATLDGNTYVRADIESRPDGGDGSVVTVIFRAEEDSVQKRMRVGDSFPWSGRVASIVRIVDHDWDGPIGWVEIHLAAPSGVTNPK